MFFHLREVASFPNSLNSLAPGSMDLVKDMLSQVMQKHPESRWFHIGADEVSAFVYLCVLQKEDVFLHTLKVDGDRHSPKHTSILNVV